MAKNDLFRVQMDHLLSLIVEGNDFIFAMLLNINDTDMICGFSNHFYKMTSKILCIDKTFKIAAG